MFVFFVWLIIILWVIAAFNRNKNKNGKKNTPKQQMAIQEKQRDLKERLIQKYKTPSDSGILERAKASVEEDFSQDYREPVPPETKPQHIDLAAEKMKFAIQYREPEEVSDGDLLKEIEDLMIKGPNTEIAFGRDFLSEGLDLLNRIQA